MIEIMYLERKKDNSEESDNSSETDGSYKIFSSDEDTDNIYDEESILKDIENTFEIIVTNKKNTVGIIRFKNNNCWLRFDDRVKNL